MRTALTSVEIGERLVAVATAQSAEGSIQGKTADLPEDFPKMDPAARGEALRKALQECGVNGRKYALVVPRRRAILREFEVPPGEPEEIQQMIRFQLERDLPLPVEDVYSTYVTRTGGDGKIHVAAVAMPREDLDQILMALEQAGNRPAHVYVSCFGLPSLLPEEESPSAVISLSNGHAEIVVADGGIHAFSRSAPVHGRSDDAFAAEVERTLLSFAGRAAGRPVEKVTIGAAGEDARRFAEMLSGHLGRPVGTYPNEQCGLALSNAVGVSMATARRPEALPDLLHPPVMRRKFRLTRTHRIWGMATLAVILIAVAGHMMLSDRKAALMRIEQELKEIQPRVNAVRVTMDRTKIAREWGDLRYSWVDLMKDLAERIEHRNLIVLNLVIEQSGLVRFSGKMRSKADVNELMANLGESKFFRSVEFKDANLNQDKSEYRWDFLVLGQLDGFEQKKPVRERRK